MGKVKGRKHGARLLTALKVQSVLKVRALKPSKLADGLGLYLVTSKTGSVSWIYRYTFGHRQKELSLGPALELSLSAARERRDAAAKHRANGNDPAPLMNATARRQHQEVKDGVPKFSQAAKSYIEDIAPGLKNEKARLSWERSLNHFAKPLHDKRLNTITSDDVADVLKPLWRTQHETARKLRMRLDAVFAEAILKGFRNTTPEGGVIHIKNPAQWKDNLAAMASFKSSRSKSPKQVRHHPSLPHKDMPEFYSTLRGEEGLAALALRLVILTACRTSEVLGARWIEIDSNTALWTIPASRMKAGREHRVPLSISALDLLQIVPRKSGHDFIFLGKDRNHHLSNMSMLMLLRRLNRSDITPHGFRSTFRTWAQDETSFSREVAEMALAHLVGDEVERSYAHSTLLDRRRQLMNEWANYCTLTSEDQIHDEKKD